MRLNKKLVAIPAIAVAAGLPVAGGYAARGSTRIITVENHTITVVRPAVTITRTVTVKPAPAKTVYMQAPATTPTEAPASSAPVAAATPAATPSSATITSTPCTTVAGLNPGGLAGHLDTTGFCWPDGSDGRS